MSTIVPVKTYPNVELASCTAHSETKEYGKNRYRICIIDPGLNQRILRIAGWQNSENPPSYEYCQFTVKWGEELKCVWLNRLSLKHRLSTNDSRIDEAEKMDDLIGLVIQCTQNIFEICSLKKPLSKLQEQAKALNRSYHYSAKDYSLQEATIVTPNFIGFGEKNVLGKGLHAKVKSARDLSGQLFARRITKLTLANKTSATNNHQTLLAKQGNPGVLQLIDSYNYRSLSGIEKQVLILEHFPMDLFTLLTERKDKIQDRLQLIDQLLQALSSLKGSHNDVKPDNILTDGKHLKLTDFEFYTPHGSIPNRSGTAMWAAPELFDSTNILNSHKVDVWGAGMIIGFLFDTKSRSIECFPQQRFGDQAAQFFQLEEPQKSIHNFIKRTGEYKNRGLRLTKKERDFVKKMVVIDPRQRITIEEAAKEFREKFLKLEPEPIESSMSSSSSTGSEGSAPA